MVLPHIKNKKRYGTSFPAPFFAWPNFIAWFTLLCEILGNIYFVIVSYRGRDVTNFEINLMFLIKPAFLHDQKVKTKMYIPEERKELLRRNKNIFHHFYRTFIEANKTNSFGR